MFCRGNLAAESSACDDSAGETPAFPVREARLSVLLSEPTNVGERKSYEKKRAIAEGRANDACVRSERRGTARRQFA